MGAVPPIVRNQYTTNTLPTDISVPGTISANSGVFSNATSVPYVALTDSDTTVANTAFVKSNITAIVMANSYKSVLAEHDLGTIAGAGTATLNIDTNLYRGVFSGSTFSVNLPTPPDVTNGFWASIIGTNTSGGTQVGTFQVATVTTALYREELKAPVTTVTNDSGAAFTLSFRASGGAWSRVDAPGDALTLGGGGSGVVGTMVQSGITTQYRVPQAADTTGTNYIGSGMIGDSTGTNMTALGTFSADNGKFTNGLTLADIPVLTIVPFFGQTIAGINASTRYAPLNNSGSSSLSGTEIGAFTPIAVSGVFTNIYLSSSTAIGAGTNLTVTLYTNGVASTLLATLTGNGVDLSTNVLAVGAVVNKGSTISLKLTDNGNVSQAVSWSIGFYSTR